MKQPLIDPTPSIFETNGIIARKEKHKRHPVSTRAFSSMELAQNNYVKPVDMPSGIVALENLTGFPSYKRGTNHSSDPIIYSMPDGAWFKFEAMNGLYPSVQHFVYLQALIAHFAYHCVDSSVHIIHLNDVMNFLGRNTDRFDISPLRTACIRYARCHATYRYCWEDIDEKGAIVKRAHWHSNYITESSFIEGSDQDPSIIESIEKLFADKRKRHWVKFHPDIVKTIVNLARFNRNRLFSRYLFELQDLDDDCKAIYCYLWTFGTLNKNGLGKVISRRRDTLMSGLSYLDSEEFDDWFEKKISILKSIGLLNVKKVSADFWEFGVVNIANIANVKDYIRKHEPSYHKKKLQGDSHTSTVDVRKPNPKDSVFLLTRAGYSVAEICDIICLGRSRVFELLKVLRESDLGSRLSIPLNKGELRVLLEQCKADLSVDIRKTLELMLQSPTHLDDPANVKIFVKYTVKKIYISELTTTDI